MQPLDGSESLVIDCSVTMAWYFNLELAMRLGVPLAARNEALEKAAQAVGVPLFAPPVTP
jgi:hypothetical protein